MVDPQQVPFYARPPNMADSLWEKAQKENPDPRWYVIENHIALLSQADTPSLSMVPALALGIGDIQKRVEAQAKTSEAHKAKLEVLLRSCHLLSFLSNSTVLHRKFATA